MTKIHVVHLTTSLKMGGAETLLCDLIDGLGSQKYRHTVIYFYAGPHVKTLEEHNIQCIQIKGLACLYDPIFCIRLFRTIRRLRPDLIHSLLWSANLVGRLIGRLLGIAVVAGYHNNADQDGAVRTALDKITRARTIPSIAVSNEVACSLKLKNISQEDVTVIANGISVEYVMRAARQQRVTRQELGLSDEHFVIGSVGRFVPVKNYPLLMTSFLLVHLAHEHVRLLLVGTGPQEQYLRDLAKGLGIENEVIFVVDKAAYGYYGIFDCFVQTTNKEGISMALLEAMSLGCACVVTNEQKNHSVITSGYDGLVVEAENEAQIAHAILSLIENKIDMRLLGKNAQFSVQKRFSGDVMVEQYDRFFSGRVRRVRGIA